jgi:hypothetical protein
MEISIKPVLWTYQTVRENEKQLVIGEHEVRIRMIQNRVPKYMATGYSSSIENWNTEDGCPYTTHPKYAELVARISKLTGDIDFEIKLAEKAGRTITTTEIKTNLTASIKINTPPDKPNKIMAYTQMIIDQLRADENPGYANIFHNCNLTLKKLLKNKDKMFLAFTRADHEAYER